jgi:hypothetical protein
MVLASTQGNATILGSVQSAGAIGGLAGGLILTAWGGPKKKIKGVIYGWVVSGLVGFGADGLRAGAAVLADGTLHYDVHFPAVEWFKPGDLAVEGGARGAGTGLLGAAVHCSNHSHPFPWPWQVPWQIAFLSQPWQAQKRGDPLVELDLWVHAWWRDGVINPVQRRTGSHCGVGGLPDQRHPRSGNHDSRS